MPITEQDIKLLKSERLTDYPDGGGRVTGQAVVDGQVNNVFGDISELDRVYGRLSLRKVYAAVLTDTVDTLYGVHVAITDPPDDGHVNVCLFDTDSWTDERDAAKSRVESYVVSGPESALVLYGDHQTGQRMLRLYCEASVPTPDVGEVFRLSIEKTGYTAHDQYVRIQRLESRQTQTFIEETANQTVSFQKDVLLLEISASLRFDFPGGTPTRASASQAPTKVRITQVADAARYYGVRPLAVAATLGDLGVNVGSPYVPLVPSTQSETPMVDVPAGMGKVSHVVCGAAGALTWTGGLSAYTAPTYPAARYLGQGCARGSVTVTVGTVTLTDDGSGVLAPPSADTSGYAGTVDYRTGLVTITRTSSWNAAVTITATAAAAVTDVATTLEVPVTLANRGYNYVRTLAPVPAPGTLTVDFRALGKWVRLTDNGRGQLAGRPGEGTGTVDYATGSVIATLAALPDVGSSLLFSWSTPTLYVDRHGGAGVAAGALDVTVDHPAVKPSTVTVSWLEGGVTKSATDNGSGALTGDATGTVDYTTGRILARPTIAPDPSSLVTVAYTSNTQYAGTASATPTGRVYTFTAGTGHTPLKVGRVRLSAQLAVTDWNRSKLETFVWTDDGAGGLTGEGLAAGATINYTTGEVSLTLADHVARQSWWGAWGEYQTGLAVTPPSPLAIQWQVTEASATDDTYTESTTHGGVAFDLTPTVADQVVPGSVRFTWAGHTYVDREGAVVRDVSAETNAGTTSGTIDYSTGAVTLTSYVTGSNAIAVASLLTAPGAWCLADLYFRTPGCPLKVQSVSVRATRVSGEQLTAVADGNGDLAATGVLGHVDVTTGVVRVRFGESVLDSSLSADEKTQEWYDAADVDETGHIWRPFPVVPSTALFNAVVYSFVPLDADILGIDPVRLPQDGLVPAFRSGDVVLVHHTAETAVASPVAGATETLRARISLASVKDATGAAVPSNRYTVDLTAGTLTWADPLDLGGYTAPYAITHRIEDLVLCSDVQITGELAFVSALTHSYAKDVSYASSCLIVGDMQARVEHLHDLATFTAWADEPTGSEANANYNAVLYPIEVTNRGAVEERWRLTFASPSTVNVIGEVYGQVATGLSILQDVAPSNPQTGVPYFRLNRLGFGSGWATGNTIRFNTRGANAPGWLARTTLQGEVQAPNDHFRIQVRGDAD